jgi:hypothetical protein
MRELKNLITSTGSEVSTHIVEAFINFKIGELRNAGSTSNYLFSRDHLGLLEDDWSEFKIQLKQELTTSEKLPQVIFAV